MVCPMCGERKPVYRAGMDLETVSHNTGNLRIRVCEEASVCEVCLEALVESHRKLWRFDEAKPA